MMGVRIRLNGLMGAYGRGLAWTCLFVSMAPGAAMSASATLNRDSARCLAHGGVSACNDAIRWNPSDPALLIALADSELRANRPADALRHYHRAAELAPNRSGLNARISAAEARLHPQRAVAAARRAPKPPRRIAPDNQYSNAAPLAESH